VEISDEHAVDYQTTTVDGLKCSRVCYNHGVRITGTNAFRVTYVVSIFLDGLALFVVLLCLIDPRRFYRKRFPSFHRTGTAKTRPFITSVCACLHSDVSPVVNFEIRDPRSRQKRCFFVRHVRIFENFSRNVRAVRVVLHFAGTTFSSSAQYAFMKSIRTRVDDDNVHSFVDRAVTFSSGPVKENVRTTGRPTIGYSVPRYTIVSLNRQYIRK